MFLKLDKDVPVDVIVRSSDWVAGEPGKKEFSVEVHGAMMVYSTSSDSFIKKVESLMGGGVFEQTWWKKQHPKNASWTYIDVLPQGDIQAQPHNIHAAQKSALEKIQRNTAPIQEKQPDWDKINAEKVDSILKSLAFKLAYSGFIAGKFVFDDIEGQAVAIYKLFKKINWEPKEAILSDGISYEEDLPF